MIPPSFEASKSNEERYVSPDQVPATDSDNQNSRSENPEAHSSQRIACLYGQQYRCHTITSDKLLPANQITTAKHGLIEVLKRLAGAGEGFSNSWGIDSLLGVTTP